MHNAPSVSYPVGRSRFTGVMLLATWLVGAVTALWWWISQPGVASWRLGLMTAVLVLAGLAAAWNWWHSPEGTLAWDGETWNWAGTSAGKIGVLCVALDLQDHLLLHWIGSSTPRWLWVERAAHAPRWGDLRRAVYSRATLQAQQQAAPPAAKT